MKRTKLSDRQLPDYSRGEEIMNMVTHIVGGAIGIAALTLCVIRAALHGNAWGVVTSAIYGTAMVAMFTISSVYHGLKPTLGKKVMQVIDHCTIYFLIAGTYTPVCLIVLGNPSGYRLLALSFDGSLPHFAPNAKKQAIDRQELTVYYDDQCPFIPDRVEKLRKYCAEKEIPAEFIHVASLEQAKNLPCVFNNWAVFYKGKFVTVNQLDGAGVEKFLKKK